jgi:hypothetical protein
LVTSDCKIFHCRFLSSGKLVIILNRNWIYLQKLTRRSRKYPYL